MLVLKDISVHFGDRILFDHLNWTIKPGEKIALIGRNGVGKTTLFKIITGEAGYDSGSLSFSKQSKVGLLKQDIDQFEGMTVKALALSAFPEISQHTGQWKKLEEAISTTSDDEEIMALSAKMSDLAEEMNHAGVHQKEAETEKVLKGLGFRDDDMDRPIEEFSGGWQMRILLARLLLMKPEYLLLDEPTNHLDIVSVIWLEEYLQEYSGTYIVISHDRRFLNRVARKVAEIEFGKLKTYAGNYDQYLTQKAEQKEILEGAYKNQQSEIERKKRLIDKYRAKASKASTAKALASELARMDIIEIEPDDAKVMTLRFPEVPRSGERVLEAAGLAKSYGDLNVFSNLDFHVLRGQKISLIGQNGQGKTTLARLITKSIAPTEGRVGLGYNVDMQYFAQDQGEQINGDDTVLEWLENKADATMRPKVRHVLGAFLFGQDDVDKKVKVLSGGERSRLAMAAMVLQKSNFLILDEPTNHLDMQSKDVLKQALEAYEGALMVISHDREFLKGLTDHTMIMHDGQLTHHIGDVDSFLDKKGFEDLMTFALSGDKKAKAEEKRENRPNDEGNKKLERQIKNVERKIEQMEGQLRQLENQMAQPGFYDSVDKDQVLDQHAAIKQSVTEATSEWERLIQNL